MNTFTHHNQIMKFTLPEPDPRNVCNFCGGSGSKDNLIQGKAANICFECSDLAKEIADEKRKEIAEKEIKEIIRLIEGYAVKNDSADIASLLYQAGYRKVE
ncbi:ClpX C4-type zinc finger protein [Proteus vulgaris]|uniref:ClpX C4-type zinc finger protein n=1 Tax=Proteus vulgaris TaxID=585 RepID=UPI0013D5595B|nr:ClpX C4-type zinc finger protein [Proteus vulgaris]